MTEELSKIKERLVGLEVEITEIKNNHLPHLRKAIQVVDKRIWYVLSSVILGFVVSIFLLLIK